MLKEEEVVDWVPEGYELLLPAGPDEVLEKAGPAEEIKLTPKGPLDE